MFDSWPSIKRLRGVVDERLPSISSRINQTIISDLSTDHWLRYIFLIAIGMLGFSIWYRVPNFAGPDEYSRLIRPMKIAGWTLSDPGLNSLRQGFLDGRALGASTYLYGLALIPIGVYVVLSGQLNTFTGFGEFESRWTLWFATPEWYWTMSILLTRLIQLSIALGCIYLIYVLGKQIADRTVGRFAALFLTLSLGFVGTAHEVGEDIPMLFALLFSLLYVFRYLEDGKLHTLLVASGLGALAIALKLTAGVIVFGISGALLARFRDTSDLLRTIKYASAGLIVGFVVLVVGMPSVLFGGIEELLVRITGSSAQKISASNSEPAILWIARKYANGFGLPLFGAVIVGFVASLRNIPLRIIGGNYKGGIVLGMLFVYLLVFSQWGYIRVHHLLPTFPLLSLLLASEISQRWKSPDINYFTIILVFLLLSTSVFTAVGVLHFANEPRDQAANWLAGNAESNDTVEVYQKSVGDVGIPHNIEISRYEYQEDTQSYSGASLVENESSFTEWMLSMPDREPKYIQLTSSDLRYADSDESEYPDRQEYIRDLLFGEYNYRVAAHYGPGTSDTGGIERFLREGIYPMPEPIEPQVIILERVED